MEDTFCPNLEMETSAIYGLGLLLGHDVCSVSSVIANRRHGTFSKNPNEIIEKMILKVLNLL